MRSRSRQSITAHSILNGIVDLPVELLDPWNNGGPFIDYDNAQRTRARDSGPVLKRRGTERRVFGV
jgi:hypothetical protein